LLGSGGYQDAERSKRSVLLRPFNGQIAQARNTYSAWQPAMNGSFDEIRCEESKRDRHVDLAHAAALSCSDHLDIWCSDLKQFVVPFFGHAQSRRQV